MCCNIAYVSHAEEDHGRPTEQGSDRMIALQADRRALNITLNSIGTELTRDDRKKLYSNFGLLYPHGHNELSIAEDFDQIRSAMEKVPAYASIFNKVRHKATDS